MRERVNQDVILGALAFCFGLFIIFYWAPTDSDSGIVEKIRGRWSIGDAFAPVAAGVIIALSGLGTALGGALRGGGGEGLHLRNFLYIVGFVVIVGVSFVVVRYAGPVIADLAGLDYRPLRDERPWKYIGFVLGGGGMIFALMTLAEGRFVLSRLALALAIAAGLALIYDLPFEDLLLPPNGDV